MAGSRFAKMDISLDSHPKIRKAGRDGREVFLFVLRKNAALDLGGRIPDSYVEPWYLADQLMVTEDEACHGMSRAVTAGLLARDGLEVVIVGWGDDWSRVPMTDAERKAKQRAKQARSLSCDSESRNVTNENVTNRDQRDASRMSRIEESRREEKRREERESA